MAQVAIREYDAKRLFALATWLPYLWVIVESPDQIDSLDSTPLSHTYEHLVVKPDQLFGKRGKYGLVGVKLSALDVKKWLQEHTGKVVTIGKHTGPLTTFLVEPFVPHDREYYIAIRTGRDHDVIYFSEHGGVDVEENWETIREIHIPLDQWGIADITPLVAKLEMPNTRITDYIIQLYGFFVTYGFVYLEINPFVISPTGDIICLDMVTRIDSCEWYRQKKHWADLEITNPFGLVKTDSEKYIDELDSQTGASLKFRVLNPHGRIWLLTSGGGASVIIADTLADLGYAHEIGNYGECSGNPDREHTRAYTNILLENMLASGHTGQYLIIAGAIANFTHIDRTFSGIIDAFREHIDAMKQQKITILVRRGGINDTHGLMFMQQSCMELGLSCEIADGNVYMTDILRTIHL